MRLADAWEDHGLVFPNEAGKTKRATALVSRSFKPILKRAGLPTPCAYTISVTRAPPCC